MTGHTRGVLDLTFSPDETLLYTSSRDGTCKIWDAVTGKEILTLREHTDTVTSITFSPDGKLVASGSIDGIAKVWDATTAYLQFHLVQMEKARSWW